MTLSQNGINLIKQFEGFVSKPYQDIVGVWTIGYGSTYCICGAKVTSLTKPVTEQFAQFMLEQNSQIYQKGVRDSIKQPMTQNQFDSMVSLCYNIGVGNFTKSTLVKKFNLGDISGAADQFLVWRLAGGNVSQGLINRRNKERQLFLTK